MSDHVHQLVFVGQIRGEYGGSYDLRWCRDCGTIIEDFGNGTAMEMTPGDVQKNLPFEIVSGVARRSRKALGRGLRDIPKLSLVKLPGT